VKPILSILFLSQYANRSGIDKSVIIMTFSLVPKKYLRPWSFVDKTTRPNWS
jgi:hypothetical protein